MAAAAAPQPAAPAVNGQILERTTGGGHPDRRPAARARLNERPPSPALARHAQERATSLQNRLADRITALAGSMGFVYIHLAWFGCWIGLGVERYPFGLLTMIVSLEAIFLSTFVLISQNRADAKRQVIADEQWQTVQEEDRQNEELLDLSRQILDLTRAIHDMAAQREAAAARWQQPSAASIAQPTKETP